jgi:hypothetical protein
MLKTVISLSILFLSNTYSSLIPDTCTLLMDSPFSNEINSLVNSPFNYEKFTEVVPNKNKCEYIKHSSFADYQTVYNFTCPKEICFRWCSYATNCMFSMYSEKEQVCIRSVGMELSDNYEDSEKYFSSNFITYRRNNVRLRYYSGMCNNYFSKKQCNMSKQCRWNRGKPGYNRESYGLGNNWCGRVKCLKN